MYCIIEKYILQHKKVCVATSKILVYYNSAKTYVAMTPKIPLPTFENHLLHQHKNPIATRTIRTTTGWV